MRLNHPEEQDDFWIVRTGPEPVNIRSPALIAIPSAYSLRVYPNPFNAEATISFELPALGHIQLGLYDITGRLALTLGNGVFPQGRHDLAINGSPLTSGIYFVQLQGRGESLTQKLVLLK